MNRLSRTWNAIAAGLAAVCAGGCQEQPRSAGLLHGMAEAIAGAKAGDADDLSAVAPRGSRLAWLSDPVQPGQTALQDADEDGLVVQPAFADGRPAAFVQTDWWDSFPRVWAQPVYRLVTGFDPVAGPTFLAGALPIFSVSHGSRFYSPYWQVQYVQVPQGFAVDRLRSGLDVLNAGFPITPGPLVYWAQGPGDVEVARAQGSATPVHPFTGDVLRVRQPDQAWADGSLVWFLKLGVDRFRVNDSMVVQEVALFRFALPGPDGQPVALRLPPVIGTGPFRTPRPADAPDGLPRFGALTHEFAVSFLGAAGGATPGIFISSSRPQLRAAISAAVGAAYVPAPSANAELLPEREQFELRVALDGTCFQRTDFPQSCTWLDTQQSIENNLPSTAFTDQHVLRATGLVFFDGVAP